MRLYTIMIAAFLLAIPPAIAQKKTITLEDIWSQGTFRAERIGFSHPMNNGKEYAVINRDRATGSSSVDIYDYDSGNKVNTVVSSADLPDLPYFLTYEFSADETQLLLTSKIQSVYRRSTLGEYYVYNTLTKKLSKVSDDRIQEPTFSPDGTKIAYGKDNNLFIFDIASKVTEQITTNGEKNKIINGITDWVYEEEFAFVRAFDWSADGKYLAYIRFDESEVPEFSMDVYGKDLYQTQQVFKYPKAGEANANVSLRVYNVEEHLLSIIDMGARGAYYIPRIQWTKDANVLSVQTLNRHQDNLKLFFYNTASKGVSLILEEKDAAYVDVTDNLTFLDDNSFIWTSEKDGWNHIYHYNADGSLKNQVTSGDWEVTDYYGYESKSDRIFYQSAENGSINRGVYSIKSDGSDKEALANEAGTNDADFSADFSKFINSYGSTEEPWRFTLHEGKNGKLIRTIKDNQKLKSLVDEYAISPKEFFTLDVAGTSLNAYMIKPLDFDASKTYPLFIYQYSGPGSQQVKNSWNGANDYWHQMLAQEGYIVVCVDPRGTGLKGRDFKKITQKELGKYEVQDQIAAAQELGKRSYIDASRIGIWGWSYGGFMSSNCLFQGADTFSLSLIHI